MKTKIFTAALVFVMAVLLNSCNKPSYEEAISYLFWGGVAFFLSMALFYLFANVMDFYEQIANTFSWIICVLFTYFTNRTFVFKSKSTGISGMGKEFISFIGARLATLVLENGILFVLAIIYPYTYYHNSRGSRQR